MGSWRKDQSKLIRRYVWGKTRGEDDSTLRDFIVRQKAFPGLAGLRPEKIGSEIHCWRPTPDDKGKIYWIACLRFIDDGWGYLTVMGRADEGRWRNTDMEGLPVSKALTQAERYYLELFGAPSIDRAKHD